MNPLEEPLDHGIGRSRGGLTTTIHQLCDGKMRPLVMVLGPGQGGNSPAAFAVAAIDAIWSNSRDAVGPLHVATPHRRCATIRARDGTGSPRP